jgi:hypothetical protein
VLSLSAHSDVILSADDADNIVRELHLLNSQIHGSNDLPTQSFAAYALGLEAVALAELLSKEVAAHGDPEDLMIATTVQGAAEVGVVIHWSGEHQRYYYDGAAFRRYLELAPSGSHAADCWFRIIEQSFYFSGESDRDSLASAAAQKQEFLANYPSYEKADVIGIYLSIDYRDLWRSCRDTGDRECAARYLNLAQATLQGIASDYGDMNSGDIAARMLIRVDKEMGEQK